MRLYVQQLKQSASQPTRSSSPVPGAQSYEMKKVPIAFCIAMHLVASEFDAFVDYRWQAVDVTPLGQVGYGTCHL